MPLRASLVSFALLVAALPAHALYKVVGPDGRITYTDRPPAGSEGRVSAIAPSGSPVSDTTLPPDLRQIVQRWPVTLYTSTDCLPCEEARRLLRQRGVPHTEKTVMGAEDREAWQRIVGGPESPALAIGGQAPLRGLDSSRWSEYLDAAGYPRSSKLPPSYQFAPALPLVPRASEQTQATPPPARPSAPPAEPVAPGGFRF